MRCSADPLVGESQHAVVAYVNDERGYGYLKDDAGQKVGISRKFLGEELFARLRLGVEVRYIGNGRGAAAAIRILD